MTWKDIIKSRFEHDDKGVYGPSYLEESNAWEDSKRDERFYEKISTRKRSSMDLKDKSYKGLDKYITVNLKRFLVKANLIEEDKIKQELSILMGGFFNDIAKQEDNLPQRQALCN